MRPLRGSDNERVNLEPLRHVDVDPEDMKPLPYASKSVPEPLSSRRRPFQPAGKPSGSVILMQVLSTLVSLTIVGLLAQVIALYNSTSHHKIIVISGLVINAWPSTHGEFLTPTYMLLGAAAIAAVFGLLACVWWRLISPSSHGKSFAARIIAIAIPLAPLGVLVASLVIFKMRSGQNELYGWSCSHKHVEVNFKHNEIGLGKVCSAMNAAWYMGIVVASFELITFLVVGAWVLRSGGRSGKTYSFMVGRRGYSELAN